MKNFYKIWALSLLVLALFPSCKEDPEAINNTPEVFVDEASDILRSSAMLSGRLFATAQSQIKECGFLVGSNSDFSGPDTQTILVDTDNGSFEAQITGLEIGSPYFYASFVSNGRERMLSTIKAFTTPTRSGALLTDLRMVDEATATVSALLADDGGGEILGVGFCWGTMEKPTLFTGEMTESTLGTDGRFTASLPLQKGTTYHIRAYALSDITNDGAETISYSQPIAVTLENEPEPEPEPEPTWMLSGSLQGGEDEIYFVEDLERGMFVAENVSLTLWCRFKVYNVEDREVAYGYSARTRTTHDMVDARLPLDLNGEEIEPTHAGVFDVWFDLEGKYLYIMSDGKTPEQADDYEPKPEESITPETWKIYYTSTDGKIVEPHDLYAFGIDYATWTYPSIVSNSYSNGKGTIVFDKEITSMGDYAFMECTNLESIIIPESVTSIGAYAFSNCSLSSILIPDAVVGIGNQAFSGCSKLASATIGQGVASIGAGAFYRCDSLETITIPDNVTTIGNEAFFNCDALVSATIGSGVISIGGSVFYDCNKLESVYCYPTTPPVTSFDGAFWSAWAAFDSCSTALKIYVPNASVAAYKTAEGWKDYADAIFPMDGITSIADISESYVIYTVEGIVTATQEKAYILADQTGAVLVYGTGHNRTIGDKIRLTASSAPYHGLIQLNTSDAIVELLSTGNSWNYNPQIMSGPELDKLAGSNICQEIQFSGTLYHTGRYAEVNVEEATVIPSLTYCDTSQYINGDTTIKGYYVGTNNEYLLILSYNSEPINSSDPELCKIYYTSTDGKVVTPTLSGYYDEEYGFGAEVVSNTYENGRGVILLNGPAKYVGATAFRTCETLRSITLPEGITLLGNQAFMSCPSLVSVQLPSTLKSIGTDAFYGCTLLKEITLPEGLTTIGSGVFYECDSLTTMAIPDSVTELRWQVFTYCNNLESVTLSNNLTVIEEKMFMGCSALKSVHIGEKVEQIKLQAFSACSSLPTLTVPASVTLVDDASFGDCSVLREIYFHPTTPPTMLLNSWWGATTFSGIPQDAKIFVPNASLNAYKSAEGWIDYRDYIYPMDGEDTGEDTVVPESWKIYYTASDGAVISPSSSSVFGANIVSNTYENGQGVIIFDGEVSQIGEKAFYNSSTLTHITIPEKASLIGREAFAYSRNLIEAHIPNGVESIGYGAFCGCYHLANISIPNSVTTLGSRVFTDCYDLANVTLSNNITTIPSEAFRNCNTVTEIQIPNSVTNIQSSAFESCDNLTSIDIPNGVSNLGDLTFSDCVNLKSFTIPRSVQRLGVNVFRNCSSLTTMTIHEAITRIGDYTFRGCSSLTSIYCLPTTPPEGNQGMFDENAPDRKIYVPNESVYTYKSAEYWSTYASDIVGYAF